MISFALGNFFHQAKASSISARVGRVGRDAFFNAYEGITKQLGSVGGLSSIVQNLWINFSINSTWKTPFHTFSYPARGLRTPSLRMAVPEVKRRGLPLLRKTPRQRAPGSRQGRQRVGLRFHSSPLTDNIFITCIGDNRRTRLPIYLVAVSSDGDATASSQ